MEEIMNEKLMEYLETCVEETQDLLETLARIPAPSHHEEKRAEFVKNWLTEQGAKGVYIDEALNVVYPLGCDGRDDIVVFMAHTDIVFPDTEPLPFHKDEERFYAPGIGDDTANLVVMLMVIKYIVQNKIQPKRGILFVANSCEEGLGNLKGSKQIIDDFNGRIDEFYTFDGQYTGVVEKCVGSHRYEVECRTEGGHSFSAFGNNNAIYELSKLIGELYNIEIPKNGSSKTTYNVGVIEGGTTVNSIAQYAKMYYEYRSDDAECIAKMKEMFEQKIETANAQGKGEFTVNVIGIRPCSKDVDVDHHEQMIQKSIEICSKHSGLPCGRRSASTDCNIPMSVGIPAVCLGLYTGAKAHTREEYVNIASLPIGLRIAGEFILSYFE